jgi:hypothetical protein
MAEQMYKTAGSQSGGPGADAETNQSYNANAQGHSGAGGGTQEKKEDVIDADFKEV